MALGWRSLDEMMDGMTSQEFSLWQRKHRYSPIGGMRADYNAAMIAQMIANMAGKQMKSPATLDDFLLFQPSAETAPAELDPAELFKQLTK